MSKISLELDVKLRKRLKQYILDHFDTEHGRQQGVIREALIAFLDASDRKKIIEIQPEVEEICEPAPRPRPKAKKLKTKGLSSDQDAIRLIKELWNSGERNRSKIGRKIGYASYAAIRQINKMVENGELKSEPEAEVIIGA